MFDMLFRSLIGARTNVGRKPRNAASAELLELDDDNLANLGRVGPLRVRESRAD